MLGGLRFVRHQAAGRNARAKNYAPETFMEMRFVKQLEDSGLSKGFTPKGYAQTASPGRHHA